jgi:uncharacterized protein (UPF0332 family)
MTEEMLSLMFDKEMSKVLHRTFELRQKADYMEQAEVTQKDVDEMLPEAINFVSKVKEYLFKRE